MSQDNVLDEFRFNLNSSVCICGPSQIGKTSFISRCISERDYIFKGGDKPEHVIYCYSIYQKKYDSLKNDNEDYITFHHGFPDMDTIQSIKSRFNNIWLILDDVLELNLDSKTTLQLLLDRVHHENITLFYVLHDLFFKSSNRRSLSLNTQFFVFFPFRGDNLSFQIFSSRIRRDKSKEFMDIYNDVLHSGKHSYFIVDMHPGNIPTYFIYTLIFKGESPIGYKV